MSGFICAMVGATFAVAAAGRTAKTITAYGNAQVDTAQSKFGGASALFDGSGDYIIVTSDPDFAFGTGDFTIEFFVRAASFSTGPSLIDFRTGNPQAAPTILCDSDPAGRLRYYANGSYRITGGTLSTNTWYHIALARSSGTTKLFIDGTQTGSDFSDTIDYVQKPAYLGAYGGNTAFANFNGHMDEIRISSIARYTGNFTAPTAAFVNDADTVLLMHANGTDASTVFTDDNGVRAPKGISAIGNAEVDTAQSKFGGASFLSDGTGYLKVINNGDFDFGTGDFTIEWWQYLTSITNERFAIDMRGGSNGSNILMYSFPASGDADDLYYYVNSANRITALNCISINVWQHIAVSRSGTSTRMFVDGTQVGSTYTDSTNYNNADLLNWENSLSSGNYTPPGNIDEFRISNIARYTANFTPSTAAFVNDANTLLLIHCDGTDGSTVFTDDNS